MGTKAIFAMCALALALMLSGARTATATDWCKGYLNIRQYDMAVQSCTEAISSGRYAGKDLAVLFFERGAAYIYKGRYGSAVSDFSKAIALEPSYTDAYDGRAVAYGYEGRYALAIADFTKAIALNPLDVNAYDIRGVFYIDSGQYALAISDFNKALALNPQDAGAYKGRGLSHEKKGEYDLAISDLTPP